MYIRAVWKRQPQSTGHSYCWLVHCVRPWLSCWSWVGGPVNDWRPTLYQSVANSHYQWSTPVVPGFVSVTLESHYAVNHLYRSARCSYAVRSRFKVSRSSCFIFTYMCLGKLKDAWYSICVPSISVIMQLSFHVFVTPRPPRPPCRPPHVRLVQNHHDHTYHHEPPRPPEDTSFTCRRVRLFATFICGGCFWLNILRKRAKAWSYVTVMGVLDNSISSWALVGTRKSAFILTISIRIFMESECTIWPSRLTYALNARVLSCFSNSDHHICGGFWWPHLPRECQSHECQHPFNI